MVYAVLASHGSFPGRVNARAIVQFENNMSSDLSSLLASSKALTSHLKRQDLPNVSLSLDQIEAQSRRLLPRQAGAQADTGRA